MLNSVPIPPLLNRLVKPPAELYTSGVDLADLLAKPRIAIVGSRKVSGYGQATTERLAKELAEQGIVIVSGLALGIDSIAHRACLEAGGQTIAVLPCGIETVYPASHRQLAARIIERQGLLLSEYAGTMRPYRHSFLERNRLIAALSDAVIVPEAAAHSGSLNTARHARELGVPVYAVPGNISSSLSEGTNQLIQQGHAKLLLSSRDILADFSIEPTAQHTATLAADAPGQRLISLLKQTGSMEAGELLARAKLPTSAYNQALTMLEIQGIIRQDADNTWRLI